MMRITIGKNAEGVVKYFTESLTQEGYFFGSQNTPGYWYGKLKEDLNLPREVSQKAFSKLAHNINPRTGKLLTLRNKKGRRSSIEYMFSAPKSVSLILVLSDERTARDILNVHRRAVRKAMREIERDMETQSWEDGQKIYARTGNIIYARFDHFLSRPTKDLEDKDSLVLPDMQLHSHCVVMNVTKYKDRYQAIEASSIHKTAQYYEALYHSYLSKGLQNMGFDIRRTIERYEINSPGMTKRTLDKFSRRKLEILAEAKKRGVSSAKSIDQLRTLTRKAKTEMAQDIDLKEEWLSRLTLIEKQAIKNARREGKSSSNMITPERAIDLSLSHHLERRSTVSKKILLAYAMQVGYGRLDIQTLRAELDRRENIIYGWRNYVRYLTTKERIREEDKMIGFASGTKAVKPPINSDYHVKREFLTDEQRQAINKILTCSHQVSILSGKAGVGKTTVLQEIHQAHKERGKKVFAFAQSATASRQVLVENGFASADTIAAFLRSKELQARVQNQTILIDEAGLLGVKDMSRIFAVAQKQNARVLLVGDTAQHNSPVYGDALRLLISKSKLEPAQITKIQRQKPNPAYKTAIKDLANGKIAKGFDKLDKMGAILEIEDVRKRHQEIAKAYISSLAQKRNALVISPTHKEGRKLSEVIRLMMRAHGRLKGSDRTVNIQKRVSLSEAQKKDATKYEMEMIVQFVQNAKGFKAGQKYEVVRHDDKHVYLAKPGMRTPHVVLPKEQGNRFQVFEPSKINLASGDKIRITHNGRTKEGARISNGQDYTVQGFLKDGSIKLNGRKTLDKDFGHLAYGYVSTSHAAQGKTADDVFIAQSLMSFGASNIKQFYVSASRAKHRVKIYTECKDELLKAVLKPADRLSARELAGDRFKAPIHMNRHLQRLRYYNILINQSKDYGRTDKTNQRELHRTIENDTHHTKE